MWLVRTLLFSIAVVCFAARGSSSESELYYEAAAPFSQSANWELTAGGGFDFSNPYLNVYAVRAGMYRALSPVVWIGAEGTGFTTMRRQSTETLERALGPYGYEARALAPEWSSVGVVRVTPLSGLLNFFHHSVWSAEVSWIARGGAIRYQGLSVGPLVGTGLEVGLGFTKHFGMKADVIWDGDSVPTRQWQSRVGFHVGPVCRF